MASPNKNWDNASRHVNHFENKMSKEFTEKSIPLTERLRMKKSDATPLLVPVVMMSHMT